MNTVLIITLNSSFGNPLYQSEDSNNLFNDNLFQVLTLKVLNF